MTATLQARIFEQIDSIRLIDSHSHIEPLNACSKTIADLLGYHYYTELAHSAGMPKDRIEEPGISPKEKVARLFEYLGHINNTVQWSWFIELSRELFGFHGDAIDASNWETVYEAALARMSLPNWETEVLRLSNVEKVFLTNDFDDPLAGFDTSTYVPCLRTDDLVFHFGQPRVQQRLEKICDRTVRNLTDLELCIGMLFERFKANQARACAISLPPWFAPRNPGVEAAERALADLLKHNVDASEESKRCLGYWVFWNLTKRCSDHKLPFDLMIGVNRRVYPSGVFQGQDLYDSRVSLIQYSDLFNAFPDVKFPISVLASVTNQELVDYAWIFPNVITHGHWWYSNTPTYIEHDLRGRLEAVPRNKQVGYYSDAYKLEFILPKFRMYKRILAKVLAEYVSETRRLSEENAVELGRQILRGNVEIIFGFA